MLNPPLVNTYLMKKQNKFLIHVAASAMLLTASTLCAQQKQQPGFVLKGHVDGAADGAKVMLIDIEGQKVLDSAITTAGNFVLKGHVNEPVICWLYCGEENANLMVENTNMTFKATQPGIGLNYTATGGREQALQMELSLLQRPYDRLFHSAYDSLEKNLYKDSVDKARLISIFNTSQDKSMEVYVDFGRRHSNSYLGTDIIYRNRKKIPKDSLLLWCNRMSAPLKNSAGAQALRLYAAGNQVRKGDRFLDFEAKTIAGKPFKLSDLKGKYIYLAFGSVGCGPCRMENREIASKYASLNHQLEIVYFSLDVSKPEWETASKKDGIVWYNVSDLKGMTGGVKTRYDVQAMPTSFLIDPAGTIVERFDGYSDDNIKRIEGIIASAN